MKALLLVDIQNDFLPGGALGVSQGDQIIPIVNDLQNHFPLVAATQDWHPQGHKSFASNHPDGVVFETVMLHGRPQVLWPVHCVQNTQGAEFSPLLNAERIEAIFRKGMQPEVDSYSGFFDNGRQHSTGLADWLRSKGVHQLFLTGLAGDYCVRYSALDAASEGFEVFFVEDATRMIDPDKWIGFRKELLGAGVHMVTSWDILTNEQDKGRFHVA